jgi:hypothetical protein
VTWDRTDQQWRFGLPSGRRERIEFIFVRRDDVPFNQHTQKLYVGKSHTNIVRRRQLPSVFNLPSSSLNRVLLSFFDPRT